MRVLVTGGTGFVGAHTVAELSSNGHRVKLLARIRQRVPAALVPLGVEGTETVLGDVTNPDSVERALADCDAVVHWNSVHTGTELVLGRAHQLGLDPIVRVSSFAALIGESEATLPPDSPTTKSAGTYHRSKAESDLVARRFQKADSPVVITCPSSVWGPHDPHNGESTQMAKDVLRGLRKVALQGQFPLGDVRDVGRLHAEILQEGRGLRRYVCHAHGVSPQDVIGSFVRLTARRLGTLSASLRFDFLFMWSKLLRKRGS